MCEPCVGIRISIAIDSRRVCEATALQHLGHFASKFQGGGIPGRSKEEVLALSRFVTACESSCRRH